MIELVKGNTLEFPGEIKTLLAVAAVVINIPILMIYLSWILPYKANKTANIVAGILTMLFIVGGGSLTAHYIIIAGIEIAVIILIMMTVVQWPDPELS